MGKYLKIQCVVSGLLIFVLGCNHKEEVKQELGPLNSFSMNLNDKLWQPSIIGNDSCMATFRCDWSAFNESPFYKIKAYKDSQSRTTASSENIFFLQIMDVNGPGVFTISDPYGDFTSYARFIKNEQGSQKIYDNSVTKKTSVATIEEMLPKEGSALTGIKGSFSGILYNKDNPKDSIIINNCKFTFKKINWGNFNQCTE